MMLQMLSNEHKEIFLKSARLLSLSDNEILLKAVGDNEDLDNAPLEEVSLAESERENAILHGFARECGLSIDLEDETKQPSNDEISQVFLAELVKDEKKDDPVVRLRAARKVFHEILLDSEFTPTAAKIVLFELMLMALVDGTISGIEWQLLQEFSHFTGVEDFIFDDLLERAEMTNKEASKTLALILE